MHARTCHTIADVPCSSRARVQTWRHDEQAVIQEVLPLIETVLAPFNARPHWGKLFAMSPTRIQALYPMMPKLRQLLLRLDPAGKFRNAFVDRYVFAASVPHVPTAIMPH